MTGLGSLPLWLIFPCALTIMIIAIEIGRSLGRHVRRNGGDDVSVLEGAVLGLLSLIIGFTFSMSLSRFDARRDALLNEANAIGTTALRARMLPAPYNQDCLALLREYTQLRLDVATPSTKPSDLDRFTQRSNEIQEALWQRAKVLAEKDKNLVPTGLFIQTLNEMIDDQQKRLTAVYNRVPDIVVIALYGIAFISAGITGYASGLGVTRSRLSTYISSGVIVAVILLIQDMDRPSAGLIRVLQQPMIDTANSLAGFKD